MPPTQGAIAQSLERRKYQLADDGEGRWHLNGPDGEVDVWLGGHHVEVVCQVRNLRWRAYLSRVPMLMVSFALDCAEIDACGQAQADTLEATGIKLLRAEGYTVIDDGAPASPIGWRERVTLIRAAFAR